MSGERIPLLPLHSSSRVHPGVGAQRIPIRTSSAVGFGAGQHFGIAAHHLGVAARPEVNNFQSPGRGTWHLNARGNWVQANNPSTTGKLDNLTPGSPGFRWNKANRKRFPQEWKRHKAERLSTQSNTNSGITLPGSNNIGPGNTVQEALTDADTIAQGHDLHYQVGDNVQESDREAISHFVHEAIQGGNPISQAQAAIGAIGLGAKHIAEHIYGGTLYGKGKNG